MVQGGQPVGHTAEPSNLISKSPVTLPISGFIDQTSVFELPSIWT
jgi:alkaline phosphatase